MYNIKSLIIWKLLRREVNSGSFGFLMVKPHKWEFYICLWWPGLGGSSPMQSSVGLGMLCLDSVHKGPKQCFMSLWWMVSIAWPDCMRACLLHREGDYNNGCIKHRIKPGWAHKCRVYAKRARSLQWTTVSFVNCLPGSGTDLKRCLLRLLFSCHCLIYFLKPQFNDFEIAFQWAGGLSWPLTCGWNSQETEEFDTTKAII